MDPVTLTTLASTLSQGSGMFGGGKGSESSMMPVSTTSGIGGPTSFSTGGFTVNKADTTTLLVVAGVAVVALVVVMGKRK